MHFSLPKFLRFGKKEISAVLALHDDFIQVAQMDPKGRLLGFNETSLEKGVVVEGDIKEPDSFRETLGALLKGAHPHPIGTGRLAVNVPFRRLYPFVRDFSGSIPDATLKAEMDDHIRENCPLPPEELSFAYEKKSSSFGAVGMPRIFKGAVEKIAADLGIGPVELVPDPYARIALFPEAPAGDFALFSQEGQKVSISLFRNGLLYDSFSPEGAIDANNSHYSGYHKISEETKQDFEARFGHPFHMFYFIGFPKALQAKVRRVFTDPEDKLVFVDGKKSPFSGLFDAQYDQMTLAGLTVYTGREKT
ncbi:hypothetical protein JXA05_01130 [Candidatus Peregrinibacteria bacterium]|nr:hypothetical protein [Candidatus Peregrinibacteria bacterium]